MNRKIQSGYTHHWSNSLTPDRFQQFLRVRM
ncbi:protein of unknown function [Burkholderia multivorans]